MEIIKKNEEIKVKQRGEPFGDAERLHLETPNGLWRDTLSITANKENIFNDERNAFMKNFEDFLANLDIDNDPKKLQQQVDSYIEQFKVYNEHRGGKLKHLEDLDTKRESDDLDDKRKVNINNILI